MTSPPLFDDPTRELLDRDVTQLQDPNAGFLDGPPNLSPDTWAKLPMQSSEYRTLTDVAQGVALAYVLLAVMQRQTLVVGAGNIVGDFTVLTTKRNVTRATEKYRTAWKYMVTPAFQHAASLGNTQGLSAEQETRFAGAYADSVFDYLNDSSADAVVAAYQHELAAKWHPTVAWARATEGYGLDSKSMTQYLKMLSQGEGREILPTVARNFVSKALEKRATNIGLNESQRSKEMGKAVFWMSEYQKGNLPVDTLREWLTAEDERVCPTCGPMDHKTVRPDGQFELPDGNKVWAPGVHPNCRCSVRLNYPEFAKRATFDPDEHPRGRGGRFAEVAERTEEQTAVEPTVAVEPTIATEPTVATEPQLMQPQVLSEPQVADPQLRQATEPQIAVTEPTLAVESPQIIPDIQHNIIFQGPRDPMYVIENRARESLGAHGAWDEDRDYRRGDIVNFDRSLAPDNGMRRAQEEATFRELTGRAPTTRPPNPAIGSVHVTPMESTAAIANRASDMYGDLELWQPFDRIEKPAYHRAVEDFYTSALNNNHAIISSMTAGDVNTIYQESGMNIKNERMTMSQKMEDMIRDVSTGGDMTNAYLNHVEKTDKLRQLVPGWEDLDDYEGAFPAKEPHTVNVFVFDRGFHGGFTGDGKQGVANGRYEVRTTKMVSLKSEMGLGAPSNVKSMRYVFLRPIEDDEH